MDNTTLNPLILGITAVAVLTSGLLLWNNRGLNDELEALKATRTVITNEAKAANERANVAERSMDEMKGELAKVQAANETVNHSVTQLRSQLEQVQIQANTAREDLEARIKTGADELGKAQGELQRVQGDLQHANDEAAKARTEKDEAVTSASRLQDDLAKERAAREMAERTARDAPAGVPAVGGAGTSGSSTGTPQPNRP